MLNDGFSVWPNKLDQKILYDLAHYKETFDIPNRGHDRTGKYYDSNVDGVQWANYWTDPLNDHPRIADIRKVVDRLVGKFLIHSVFYHADISVVTPLNSLIRPHVDTPYRHAPWNHRIRNCLGVQVGIPLHDITSDFGSTAFVPGSHRSVWEIDRCYNGEYTDTFMKTAEQPEVRFGDVLLWDARTLHSQMPNIAETSRYMLLLTYVEERIVSDLMQYEAGQHGIHT